MFNDRDILIVRENQREFQRYLRQERLAQKVRVRDKRTQDRDVRKTVARLISLFL